MKKDYFDVMIPVPAGFTEEDLKAFEFRYPNLVFELVETTVGTRMRICGQTTAEEIEKIKREV